MNITQEIQKFSAEEDQPILLALFEKYHWSSQWSFVANCTMKRYGTLSYEVNRIWSPTEEGRCLYEYLIMKDNPMAKMGQECACGNLLQLDDRQTCKECVSSSKLS